MTLKYVKPSGDPSSKFVIVGEAPGKDEEEQGKPFVGRSGRLLDKILAEFGIKRDKVYVTNVVKVRPENNRTPSDKELKEWSMSLYEELNEINPHVILTLGTCAAKVVLNNYDIKISYVRGAPLEVIPYGKVICCFHPAYIIRNSSRLDTFKKDIKLAIDTYKSITGGDNEG